MRQHELRSSHNDLFSILLSFDGRVPRQTYWTFTAFVFALVIVGRFVHEHFSIFAAILLFWPSLAISVKRWHDRDKSGWWILIGFVPLVGPIWALVEQGFLKGTDGPNNYGEDPLQNLRGNYFQ